MPADLRSQLQAALADRYTLERELGRGGMATVYLAHDLKHDRPVALKAIHPELAAVLGAERFLTEIKVTANLQHPHILPLFDSGQVPASAGGDGLLYYVMPFVAGESLRSRFTRERQLPIEEAVRIAQEVASALEYAHRRGVVHRDIKPENILLQDGTALVADFGIALAVSHAGGHRLTQTGLSLGTPQYMSPEQAMGERNVDGRSDIYALACTLYETLAGEPPFTGPSSQAVLAKVITESPPPVTRERPMTPPHVVAAIHRGLQKLPADRFTSAAQFAEALRGPTSVAATTVVPPRARQARVDSVTRWRIATAVACLTAAGVIGWALRRLPSPTGELQLARQLTFDGTVQGAAISPDGSWLAYITTECTAETERCTSTLQVREVDGTQSVRLLSWPVLAPDLKWSPDGSTVLFRGSPGSGRDAVYLTKRLGGSVRRLDAQAGAMDFTPDGRRVVLTAASGGLEVLVRYDVASLAMVDSVALPVGLEVGDLQFSPRGDRLAVIARVRGSHEVFGLLDSTGRLLDSLFADTPTSVRWDPHGSALLYFEPGPGIADNLMRLPVRSRRFDPEARQIILGQVPTGYERRFDAARTGRIAIVAAATTHKLSLTRLDSPKPTWLPLTQRSGFAATPAISPDGSRIAVAATDNLGDNLYVFQTDGGTPQAVTSYKGAGGDWPRWSPDGRHLAYRSYRPPGVALTDVAGGRPRMVVSDLALAGGLHDWVADDAVVVYRGGALEVLDTLGRRRGVLPIPDSLGDLVPPLVADQRTEQVAYWSPVAHSLVLADLRAGRLRRLLRSPQWLEPLGWGDDGSLFAAIASGDPLIGTGGLIRRIVRIPRAGGQPSTVLSVTVTCSNAVVGAGGRLAVCAGTEVRPDVWLADRAGKSGW
jgi:Tol biopolymer transport system component